MTEDQDLKALLLRHIATGAWTTLAELNAVVSDRQRYALGVVLAALVRKRLLWKSHEVVLLKRAPIMIARYCRPHEIGDPPIGHRIVREAAE